MQVDRAEQYRREAEKCLDQAELFSDEAMKSRMRMLADEWLKLAAKVASEDRGVN
jgi:ATP/maltotriose-dependent transcriptional regulator MalT